MASCHTFWNSSSLLTTLSGFSMKYKSSLYSSDGSLEDDPFTVSVISFLFNSNFPTESISLFFSPEVRFNITLALASRTLDEQGLII